MGRVFQRLKVGLSGQPVPLRNQVLPEDGCHWLEGLRSWSWRSSLESEQAFVEEAYDACFNQSFYRWLFIRNDAAYISRIRNEVRIFDESEGKVHGLWRWVWRWWYGIDEKRRLYTLYDLSEQLSGWLKVFASDAGAEALPAPAPGVDVMMREGMADHDFQTEGVPDYHQIQGAIDFAHTLGYLKTEHVLYRLSCLSHYGKMLEASPIPIGGDFDGSVTRKLSSRMYEEAKVLMGLALGLDGRKASHVLIWEDQQLTDRLAHLQGHSASADLVLVEALCHGYLPHKRSLNRLMEQAFGLDKHLRHMGSKVSVDTLSHHMGVYLGLRKAFDGLASDYIDLQGACRPEQADAKLYEMLLQQHRLAYEAMVKVCDRHLLSIESSLAIQMNEVMSRLLDRGMGMWRSVCRGRLMASLDESRDWYDQLLPIQKAEGFLQRYEQQITKPLKQLESVLKDYPEPWHRLMWESLGQVTEQMRWLLDPKLLLEEVVRPLMVRRLKVGAWLKEHGARLESIRPAYVGKIEAETKQGYDLGTRLSAAKKGLQILEDEVEGKIESQLEQMRLRHGPQAGAQDEDGVRNEVRNANFGKHLHCEGQIATVRNARDLFVFPERLRALEASWGAYQSARLAYDALPQGLRMGISCELLHIRDYTRYNIEKRHGTEEEAWLHYIRPLNHYLLYFRPMEGVVNGVQVQHVLGDGCKGEGRGTWHVLGRDHVGRICRLDLKPDRLGSPWRKHRSLLKGLTRLDITQWGIRSTVEVKCYPLLETLSEVLGVPLLRVGPDKGSSVVSHDASLRELYREKYLPLKSVMYELDELLRRDRRSVVDLYEKEPSLLPDSGWVWLQRTVIAGYDGDRQGLAPLLRHRYAYDVENPLALRHREADKEGAAGAVAVHPGAMLVEPGRDEYRIEGRSYGMDLYDHVGRGEGRRWLDQEVWPGYRIRAEGSGPSELSKVSEASVSRSEMLAAYVHGKELVAYNKVYKDPDRSLRYWDRERGYERHDYLFYYAVVNFYRIYREFKTALLSAVRAQEVADVSTWLASVRSDANLQNLKRELDHAHVALLQVHPDHNMALLSEFIEKEAWGGEVIEGAKMLCGAAKDKFQAIKDALTDDAWLRALLLKEYIYQGDQGCGESRRMSDADIHLWTYLEEHFREISITGEHSKLLGIRRLDEENAAQRQEIEDLRAQLLAHGITPVARDRSSKGFFSGFGFSFFGGSRRSAAQQSSSRPAAPVYEGDDGAEAVAAPAPGASQSLYE